MTEDTCTEDTTCGLAKKEFKVIRDLLLVPLKPDSPNEELPERRKWKSGCLPVLLPDLVPVNPFPGEGLRGFCKPNNRGNVVVIVKNQGNATAPPSTTRVIFSIEADIFDPRDKPTPEIVAGGSFTFELDPPNRCPPGSICQLIIIVNAKFEVVESDFTNNVAIGLCNPQPQPPQVVETQKETED